jgi:cell division protein FtsI/penicillin-binding protein 2
VEHGQSGGRAAGPIAKAIISRYMKQRQEKQQEQEE